MPKRLVQFLIWLCAGFFANALCARDIALLPAPRTNLAAVAIETAQGARFYTFYGLGPGKRASDISTDVYEYVSARNRWRRRASVPVSAGRLAPAAVAIGKSILVIGGYTVAADGSERSASELLRYEPASGRFEFLAPMPVPVDDTVALAWRDRYLVLVSGWHHDRNVDAVQIYDLETDRWTPATPWPGTPVFGHSGGIVDDTLVICDGVTAVKGADGKNAFAATNACFLGSLDPTLIGAIAWQPIPAHPGEPRYRSAALGTRQHGARVVFVGGAENPYNYDGIGYDGVPAEPSAAVLSFDLATRAWARHSDAPAATMDHRNLLALRERLLVIGGMREGQAVTGAVMAFTLSPPVPVAPVAAGSE
jgi:hypothetical protein